VTDPLLERAVELQRRGEPFVLATVVRCEAPTSAKPGAKALVRADGTVEGWVGGACAEPVVAREAINALRDGRPRLVGLYGEGGRVPDRAEGILGYPMTCHSGGTLEIYVEPYLPTPVLVLLGHGPVVATLATLGRAAGYDVVPLADDAAWTGLDALGLGRWPSVVVATHADSDEDALERVLKTRPATWSLVASRRRATAVVEAAPAVPSERPGRFKARPGSTSAPSHPPDRSSASGRDHPAPPRRQGGRRGASRDGRRADRGARPDLRDDSGNRDGAVSLPGGGPYHLLLLSGLPGDVRAGPPAVPSR
jgi:xanthine dehydrogenase accessory factor